MSTPQGESVPQPPSGVRFEGSPLAELTAEMDDPDLARQIVTMTRDDLPSRIADIRSLAEAGLTARVASAAHEMRSTSALVGAARLSSLCAEVESAALQDELVPQLVSDLLAEAIVVNEQLDTWDLDSLG